MVVPKSETFRRLSANNPFLWIEEREDEDDIFMPPLPGSASSKGKSSSSSKGKSSPSSKGNSSASTDGKRTTSSKGKRAASTEDDDDDFM